MMTPEEIQGKKVLDDWYDKFINNQLQEGNKIHIQSEEEYNQIKNELNQINKFINYISRKYGLKNEKMD